LRPVTGGEDLNRLVHHEPGRYWRSSATGDDGGKRAPYHALKSLRNQLSDPETDASTADHGGPAGVVLPV
jgi:hypothetical protein